MTRFPGCILSSKRTHSNAAKIVRCVCDFLLNYSCTFIKNSSSVKICHHVCLHFASLGGGGIQNSMPFVQAHFSSPHSSDRLASFAGLYWLLDIWCMGSEDLSPQRGDSKFDGFCAGSLFLAPFISPARFNRWLANGMHNTLRVLFNFLSGAGSGSGSVIQGHSIMVHQRNQWIHSGQLVLWFFWCTMVWVILDHWSWSRSSQRNTPLVSLLAGYLLYGDDLLCDTCMRHFAEHQLIKCYNITHNIAKSRSQTSLHFLQLAVILLH